MGEPGGGSLMATEYHQFEALAKWKEGYCCSLASLLISYLNPFWIKDELKCNFQTYCQFLEDTFFKQWYRKKSTRFKKVHDLIHDLTQENALLLG